ncbi:hypothetical protein AGOR_G00090810 [Albula goreensis]|uniref:ABC transporter TMD0 domain-containing protein n=1 Tax=Albula goreensis TaxID=1534307 RepID=A0A8T3DJ24_9TELE|nr:hypothetical protein AGOR_G00090810 [Albula goreensis]
MWGDGVGSGPVPSGCAVKPHLPREGLADWNRTWYTPNPDLTQCFQNTVLVWVPCIYLWICAPFYCLYLYCHDRGHIPVSCLCSAKMVFGFLLASFGFVEFFYILLERNQEIQQHLVFLLSPIIRSLTVVLAICIIQLERMRGCRSSIFLFLFWLLAVLCSLVPLRAKIQLAVEEVREMTRWHGPRSAAPILLHTSLITGSRRSRRSCGGEGSALVAGGCARTELAKPRAVCG